jgi:hypothetical protein
MTNIKIIVIVETKVIQGTENKVRNPFYNPKDKIRLLKYTESTDRINVLENHISKRSV